MIGNRSRTEKILALAGCLTIPSHMTTTKEVFGDTKTLNRPDKSAETDNKSTLSDQHENLVLVEGGTNENCEHNFVAPRSNNECQVLVEEPMNTTAVANEGQHRDAVTYAVSSCGTEGGMKLRFAKLNERNYYVSPINSDESDVDDTDLDKNFEVSESSESVSNSSEGLGAGSPDVLASPKKGKKRKATPDNWITKRAKNLRNSGKAYLSTSKSKKQVSARKVRPPCGEKCRLNCSLKIDQNIREVLFNNFWKLGNLQQQREFIARNTGTIKPKYRYSSTQDFRQLNSAFYFEIDNNRIRVCKKFFKATLDINDRPIRTALSKKNNTGFVDGDKRGKHGKQPTVNPEIKESVRKFINSIPRIESHYLRAQSKCEYIEGGKSLADIYRDYKEQRVLQELPFANSVMFNRIFNGEFNISFYIPKKDQCDLCETYKNADDEEKEKLVNIYNLHQEEKELCRKEKDLDKNNQDGLCVAVYDLQAVMPIPKGLVSSFYYASKLNCFNFTISDLRARNVECYFWNETEGKRGAVEIGTCVLNYIKTIAEKAKKSDIDIILYSDNCCGQQKNKYLLSAYAYAVANFNVRSIVHKFLICGHTQNEGDNVHSVIEKQTKRYLKSSPLYTPDQYATLIRTAKKNGRPYEVHEMTFSDFFDLKGLQEEWGTNFTSDTCGKKVKWNDLKILRVQKDEPRAFFYKTSYKDEDFKKVCVRKTRTQQAFDVHLLPAYEKKFPLTEVKKKALKSLCDKNIIKKIYYERFYKNIFELH